MKGILSEELSEIFSIQSEAYDNEP